MFNNLGGGGGSSDPNVATTYHNSNPQPMSRHNGTTLTNELTLMDSCFTILVIDTQPFSNHTLSSFCSRLCVLYLTHRCILQQVVLFQPQDLCSCYTGLLHVIWNVLLLYHTAAEEKKIMHLYDSSHVRLAYYSMNLQINMSNELKHMPSVTLLLKATVAERM